MSARSVISLFTGIGGLDFGFEAAGFHTAAAVELDPVCRNAIADNRGWPVAEQDGRFDIATITTDRLLEVAALEAEAVDMLIGGPPCQPFSKSGYWHSGDSKRLLDPRANTIAAFLRIVDEIRPRAFLLENVQGFAFRGKAEGLALVVEGLRKINRRHGTSYQLSWATLNSADFGAPQLRKRVFLVASREGIRFKFPAATHSAPEVAVNGTPRYRTAWDAIGDLPEPDNLSQYHVGGRWGKLLPSIPEGQNYLWHTPRGGGRPIFAWRSRYWTFLLKLAKTQPAWTVQASPGTATGPFHWQNRRLTADELCRLQTLPEGLKLRCSHREAYRMIGNAVPSLLAELLAREIRIQLFADDPLEKPLVLMPPRRGDPPPPEPPEPVAAEYERYIGGHADHPGTGKGPGALRREQSRPTS
jgi:DNA (cytosine-5)-methyltransferase 1